MTGLTWTGTILLKSFFKKLLKLKLSLTDLVTGPNPRDAGASKKYIKYYIKLRDLVDVLMSGDHNISLIIRDHHGNEVHLETPVHQVYSLTYPNFLRPLIRGLLLVIRNTSGSGSFEHHPATPHTRQATLPGRNCLAKWFPYYSRSRWNMVVLIILCPSQRAYWDIICANTIGKHEPYIDFTFHVSTF